MALFHNQFWLNLALTAAWFVLVAYIRPTRGLVAIWLVGGYGVLVWLANWGGGVESGWICTLVATTLIAAIFARKAVPAPRPPT